MKIKAIAPWYGGKRTLAPAIVQELGQHKAYWEPFCGSMAVLLAKPACRLETTNDLHGDVINMARVIRDPRLSRELYQLARLVPCSDDELKLADAQIRTTSLSDLNDVNVSRALNYLVVCWMGRNGECGLAPTERSTNLCIRWTNNGGAPATRWLGVVRSIASWHRRLRTVTITRRDGFEMLKKIADERGAAIYIDPPYIKKSDQYLHDFAPNDHEDLARLLARFKNARIVISYYDHPIVRELYGGWTFVDHSRGKNLHNQSGRGERRADAPEVLIVNGKSYAQ